MATTMTEQDLVDGAQLADKIIEMVTRARPPAAVAAVSIALAAVTHLAECGPDASISLFRSYFDQLGRAAGTGG